LGLSGPQGAVTEWMSPPTFVLLIVANVLLRCCQRVAKVLPTCC
jgi:hypothetical protein